MVQLPASAQRESSCRHASLGFPAGTVQGNGAGCNQPAGTHYASGKRCPCKQIAQEQLWTDECGSHCRSLSFHGFTDWSSRTCNAAFGPQGRESCAEEPLRFYAWHVLSFYSHKRVILVLPIACFALESEDVSSALPSYKEPRRQSAALCFASKTDADSRSSGTNSLFCPFGLRWASHTWALTGEILTGYEPACSKSASVRRCVCNPCISSCGLRLSS